MEHSKEHPNLNSLLFQACQIFWATMSKLIAVHSAMKRWLASWEQGEEPSNVSFDSGAVSGYCYRRNLLLQGTVADVSHREAAWVEVQRLEQRLSTGTCRLVAAAAAQAQRSY